MQDTLAGRVGAAARAAWWTILIAALWLTAIWLAWLPLLHYRPDWILTLWGGQDLSWDKVRWLMLNFVAIFKLILWVALLLAIWLSLWSRRLGKLSQP